MTLKKAKESAFIKRTRNKLKRRLAEIDNKVTPQALKEVSRNIYKWIRRHSSERELVPGTVRLFDENTHSAQAKSQYVSDKLKELKAETEREYGILRGRISTPTDKNLEK